ncbi:MAG: thioesterase, partial [Maribacter dokdonensis]
TVTHRWINQNPFNSMFWAVQGMAAELSTGAMMIDQIEATGKKISMLVANNKANFSKKATGKITFTCEDGHLIKEALEKTIVTGEGQTIWMKSVGVNEDGVVVSTFDFEWTVRLKQKK